MPGPADTVRAAQIDDVPQIARIQARAYHASYAELLDADLLAELDGAALESAWRDAVAAPPSPRHQVLVALGEGGDVVGFAALGPSGDPDAGPADGEVTVLLVDPDRQRRGHGSRLLAAAAEQLRRHGSDSVATWTPNADLARRAFLGSAGLAEDGARREHAGAAGDRVAEIRLSASLPDAPAG